MSHSSSRTPGWYRLSIKTAERRKTRWARPVSALVACTPDIKDEREKEKNAGGYEGSMCIHWGAVDGRAGQAVRLGTSGSAMGGSLQHASLEHSGVSEAVQLGTKSYDCFCFQATCVPAATSSMPVSTLADCIPLLCNVPVRLPCRRAAFERLWTTHLDCLLSSRALSLSHTHTHARVLGLL